MIRIVLLAIALIYGFSNSVLGKTNSQFRPGKDYALFFANDDYRTNPQFNNLKNPVKDAEAIADELKEMFGFETFVYKNYTKNQIYQKLEEWQGKSFKEDAQLFIFFSGHGTFWESSSAGYFVPKGNQTGYDNYIGLTILGNFVTKIDCPHILLAIDACYSGTIDQEIAFKGEKSFRRPNENLQNDRTLLIGRQLRNTSRLLITSGGKERTPDGDRHSPFATAILDGLKRSYSEGDGLFIFPDLLAKLERVNPRPHRGELVGHDAGGFVFIAEGFSSVPKVAVVPPNNRDNPPIVSNTNDFSDNSKGTFSDRDGNTYAFKTMKDDKRWMTQNLNIKIQGSYCYDGKDENCRKYGRLYTFEAAKEGCRLLGDGWRLPTDAEWKKLAESYGGLRVYENSDWVEKGDSKESYKALSNNGSSGFAALLGGWRGSGGSYGSLGTSGVYWASTEVGSFDAWFYSFSDGKLWRYNLLRSYGHSVRCLQD